MSTNTMQWVSVRKALPQNGQAVFIRYKEDNWELEHTLTDGTVRQNWRWQAAQFQRGRTAKEIAADKDCVIEPADQCDNNLRPYCWATFGEGELFGQDVTHWAAITDPLSK